MTTKAKARTDLERLVGELEERRDHLRVRLHLAKAEARDEFEALEKRWDHLRGRLAVLGREAGHAAEDVGGALAQVATELKNGYERLRTLL